MGTLQPATHRCDDQRAWAFEFEEDPHKPQHVGTCMTSISYGKYLGGQHALAARHMRPPRLSVLIISICCKIEVTTPFCLDFPPQVAFGPVLSSIWSQIFFFFFSLFFLSCSFLLPFSFIVLFFCFLLNFDQLSEYFRGGGCCG